MSVSQTFDNAIVAHLQWIGRLVHALRGANREAIPLDEIGDSTRCELGRWLLARRGGPDDPEAYERIASLHARFHREAEAISSSLRDAPHGEVARRMAVTLDPISRELVDALAEARDAAARRSGEHPAAPRSPGSEPSERG